LKLLRAGEVLTKFFVIKLARNRRKHSEQVHGQLGIKSHTKGTPTKTTEGETLDGM
jgi:hypothetical protein